MQKAYTQQELTELNVHQWKECQNNKYLFKVNTQSANLCILVGIKNIGK